MKLINQLLFVFFISIIFSSCNNILNKPLNKEDFEKVKKIINNDNTIKNMKKKYILDNTVSGDKGRRSSSLLTKLTGRLNFSKYSMKSLLFLSPTIFAVPPVRTICLSNSNFLNS